MLIVPVEADIVFSAFHQEGIQFDPKGLSNERHILEEYLFLEVFCACAYYCLLPA